MNYLEYESHLTSERDGNQVIGFIENYRHQQIAYDSFHRSFFYGMKALNFAY